MACQPTSGPLGTGGREGAVHPVLITTCVLLAEPQTDIETLPRGQVPALASGWHRGREGEDEARGRIKTEKQ